MGGEGKVVEIDESKSGKVKVQWPFGGVARETGRMFLVVVQDRTAETLMAGFFQGPQ